MKRKKISGVRREEECEDLRLAEYSAPFGEEMPWRIATGEFPAIEDACSEWKPERGSLH